ncbi:hypothetical protein NITMOv2_1353 [Nitrospira moscoviensis]|uniref:Uncharacterized protein n=1 Tax=Nitrospira moscoviensis TaxID=42253 RepID=A0A0K2G9Y3_NITMO|nr:hypothetical protein NITMOv2_1353 [Nitrospira moscoviensis]
MPHWWQFTTERSQAQRDLFCKLLTHRFFLKQCRLSASAPALLAFSSSFRLSFLSHLPCLPRRTLCDDAS